MIISLIKNQIRETTRSSFWKRNVVANIFIFALYAVLALNFLIIGLLIDKVLIEIAPGEDHIYLFNSVILIYFGSELLIRFFVQKVHAFKIIPYLYLPIKRSYIKNYLLAKPFFSLFNFTQFLIAIPFALKILSIQYSSAQIFSWLIFLFFFIQMINYLNLLVNRLALRRTYYSFLYICIILVLSSSAIFNIMDIKGVSANIFMFPLTEPMAFLFPLIGVVIFYCLNYFFLTDRFYLDDLQESTKSNLSRYSNIDFSKKFGEVGSYISLEVKLLLRNKRPSSTLLFGIPFLLIGFMAYGNEAYTDSYFFSIYWGVLLVGCFMLFYGQFLFAWESSYFDAIIGKNINLKKYLQAKFYLLVSLCSVSFLLTLPYAYFGLNVFIANVNVYLFSIGVSSYFYIFLGTYSRKRVDIQASLMSMQGKGAAQFISILPVLLAPILISLPVKFLFNDYMGYLFLGTLGIIGLILNKQIINILYKQFNSQKYKLAEAFRESE